jgi:ElaA protein
MMFSLPSALCPLRSHMSDFSLRWDWRAFHELTPETLYAALRLRQQVFVVEQTCPYLDADGRDADAWHLLGWATIDGAPRLVAYARVFAPGTMYPADASIGRVVTDPVARGSGIGRALMDEALRRIAVAAPGAGIRGGAQAYLEAFYTSLGFRRVGENYDEDGIPHVEMVRDAGSA